MVFKAPEHIRIGIAGLGYVGLPLAVAFGKILPTAGYDSNPERIRQLQAGNDRTGEVTAEELEKASLLHYTGSAGDLSGCNVYILAIPTPITATHAPDFTLLNNATAQIAALLKPGDLVIFESTVYPGATEELMVPVLEKISGLTYNTDFFAGYSPERINPGDRIHRLENIVKITSGSTPEAAEFVDALYRKIIMAGTFRVSSIKVAEAAKAIENAQRDINIAFVNELAVIFSKIGLNTREVLDAAGSKWNFLPFTPGLVGGHCIGVDPYYLAHKAQMAGHHPEIILAGRKINDAMPAFVAGEIQRLLENRNKAVAGSKGLLLGITFKENCPDIRNSGAVTLATHLMQMGMEVEVYDPVADTGELNGLQAFTMINSPGAHAYDAIILAVSHAIFAGLPISQFKKPEGIVYDIRSFLPAEITDGRL